MTPASRLWCGLCAAGRYFEPFSSDLVTLRNSSAAADWDALNEPYRDPNTGESVFPGNFAPSEGEAGAAQWAAISGAASRFISLFFCNNRTQQLLWCTAMDRILNETMESDGNEDRRNFPLAFRQGEDIASLVSFGRQQRRGNALTSCKCSVVWAHPRKRSAAAA